MLWSCRKEKLLLTSRAHVHCIVQRRMIELDSKNRDKLVGLSNYYIHDPKVVATSKFYLNTGK